MVGFAIREIPDQLLGLAKAMLFVSLRVYVSLTVLTVPIMISLSFTVASRKACCFG
jgi:hypothetical protein